MLETERLKKFAESHELALVALFGSTARGTPAPGDLDLALQPIHERAAGAVTARDLVREFGRSDVDVAWLPSASSLLWKEVAREGQALYELRPGLFQEMRAEALRRHWDGEVWRQRKRDFITRTVEGNLALNRELVEDRLAALAEYLRKLNLLMTCSEAEFLEDFTRHHAAERLLELLVEHAGEINSEVGQSVASVAPSDYYTSFFTLAQTGWITKDLAQELAPIAGLRNMLVHRYRQVTLSDLYLDLKRSLPAWGGYLAAVRSRL